MLQVDSIREGFRHAHKNWQLIVLQLLLSIVLFIGLIVVVVAFILAAIVVLGLNIEKIDALGDMLGNVKDPMDLLADYAGLAIGLVTSFLLYSIFAISVWTFTLGGSAGVLGLSIMNSASRLGPRDFLREGKRLFWPVAGITGLIGLIFIVALGVMGLLAGGGATLWEMFFSSNTRLAIFLTVLFSLMAFTAMLIVVVYLFALAAWSVASLVIDGTGIAASIRNAERFIRNRPESMGLLLISIFVLGFVQFTLMSIWYTANLLPVVGLIMTLPFQIIAYAVQGYVNMALMAAVLAYYYHAHGGVSTQPTHTAEPSAGPQAPAHEGSAQPDSGAPRTSPEQP